MCKYCSVEYNLVFKAQFHKEGCPALQTEESLKQGQNLLESLQKGVMYFSQR